MADREHDAAARTASAAALRVLSGLAPDRREPGHDVSGSGPTLMAWLGALPSGSDDGDPTSARRAALEEAVAARGGPPALVDQRVSVHADDALDALARYDALSPGINDLRLGWLWVVGQAQIEGVEQRVLRPLVSRRVHVSTKLRRRTLEPSGPWDLWSLVHDPATAARLEADATFGGGAVTARATIELLQRLETLQAWVARVLAASGLPSDVPIVPPEHPVHRRSRRLAVVAGYGVYADQLADPSHPRETLAAWAADPATSRSAFAHLYAGPPASLPDPPPAARAEARSALTSPFPLTDRQADVVLAARHAALTVVSGPPGTGKSQTAAAVALDVVARGGSVLVATRSATAADVLAELLDRVPGPTPVLFGGGQRATKLAAELADGLTAHPATDVDRELAAAERRARDLQRSVVAGLDAVVAAAEWEQRALTLPGLALLTPGLLDTEHDEATLAAAAADLAEARSAPDGWWAGRRRAKAERRLRSLAGAGPEVDLDDVATAVDLAHLRRRARALPASTGAAGSAGGSEEDDARWLALVDADDRRRQLRARSLAERVAADPGSSAHRAVSALSLALRAGRAARRAHLAEIDLTQLTAALPLWVGTLGDIENLLPSTAAGFDLVILDEASQIDQQAASGALLRAKRAVVIGDPRQLRFVSFTPDARVAAVVAEQHAGWLADRLDVRRVSAFDLAAGAAPVTFLDEHFRSVPHLIGFSARRFYDDRLTLATRHPANETARAIEVRTVSGERADDGVNVAEVDAAVDAVREVLADPARAGATIGVVSPYRPQVDALRQAVGAALPIEVLEAGRVRVGTVHGFQGGECDVVVASFGISDATGRRRRFLEDPNLFNVLVTRARHRLIVLASVDDPPPGLLADYLRWAATPPAPEPGEPPTDRWTADLARVLGDGGVPVRTGYPVGRHRVDLVVGDGPDAVAVTTTVHPDGTDAHVRRHLDLARAGWRQTAAFDADATADPVAAALALGHLLGRP